MQATEILGFRLAQEGHDCAEDVHRGRDDRTRDGCRRRVHQRRCINGWLEGHDCAEVAHRGRDDRTRDGCRRRVNRRRCINGWLPL